MKEGRPAWFFNQAGFFLWRTFCFFSMMLRMRPFFLFLVLCLFARSAAAAEITEIHALNFGIFSLWDNTVPRTIVLAPNGSVTYSRGIAPEVQAQRGEYLLENFPPNMTFTLGLSIPNPPTQGGMTLSNSSGLAGSAGGFSVSQFTTNALSTDASGNATLYIGATLTSSGSGVPYVDGVYNGTVDMTFFY